MTDVLIAVGALTLLACVPLVARVKREYEIDGVLSATTVTAVWILYTIIVAVVVLAAAEGSWDLGLSSGLALAIGLPLIAIGSVVTVAGLTTMASFRRMSGIQPDRLIAAGAFRYSRNPQNVGLGILLLGVSVLGSSALALAMTVGFWLVFYAYVRYEERHLERLFGDEYQRYMRATPRVLGLPRSPGGRSRDTAAGD